MKEINPNLEEISTNLWYLQWRFILSMYYAGMYHEYRKIIPEKNISMDLGYGEVSTINEIIEKHNSDNEYGKYWIEKAYEFGLGEIPDEDILLLYPGFSALKNFDENICSAQNAEEHVQEIRETMKEKHRHAKEKLNTGVITRKTNEEHLILNLKTGKKPKFAIKGDMDKKIIKLINPDFGRKRILYQKNCEYCGRTFATLNNSQKYCYPGCKQKYFIESRKERNIAAEQNGNEERICPICGDQISGRSDKKTCGMPACRQAYYRNYGPSRK